MRTDALLPVEAVTDGVGGMHPMHSGAVRKHVE